MVKRFITILVALWLAGYPAWAQQPVTSYPAPWNQVGSTVSLSVSNSTGRVQLGWVATGQAAPATLFVFNTGTVSAYIALGDSTVTATTSGVLVPAGTGVPISLGNATYLAGITASSTTTLSIAAGSGSPLAKGGGGGGSGSGMLTDGSNATSAALNAIASASSNAFSAAQSMPALNATGAAGNGFIDLLGQGTPPAAPASNHMRIWNGIGTFTMRSPLAGGGVALDVSTVTSGRGFTVPDVSGTWVTTGNLTAITATGTVGSGTWQGTKIGLAFGGTNADLSATGGASQVLKQVSGGAAITVGQLACTDLSNGATGCSTATGTSGATIPLLNGTNTWSGKQTFGNVVGSVSTQSGTGSSAYTFASTDCGTLILATGASAATYTVPNSLPAGCNIAVSQETAGGQVTIAAGASATFNANPHGYTKTFGQYAIISVSIKSNAGSAAVFTMLGDGA